MTLLTETTLMFAMISMILRKCTTPLDLLVSSSIRCVAELRDLVPIGVHCYPP